MQCLGKAGPTSHWWEHSVGRVGPAPHRGSTVELALVGAVWECWPCHPSAMGWHGHRGWCPSSHTLPPLVVGKAPHGVMGSGELTLSITSYSTQESRRCTSSGQHSRAGPGGESTSEPAPRALGELASPLIWHEVARVWGWCPPHHPLTTCSSQESWPWRHESRTASPALPPPHLGNTALMVKAWVSQPQRCESLRELVQPLTGCSPWESGALTLTEKYNGAGSGGVGMKKLPPQGHERGDQQKAAMPADASIGFPSWNSAGELIWGGVEMSWVGVRDGKLTKNQYKV